MVSDSGTGEADGIMENYRELLSRRTNHIYLKSSRDDALGYCRYEFQTYRNSLSAAVAAERWAFRVARFNAERMSTFVSGKSDNGIFRHWSLAVPPSHSEFE